MKSLTWQQVVIIVALLAAPVVAFKFGGANAAAIAGTATTAVAALVRSPLTPKDDQ